MSDPVGCKRCEAASYNEPGKTKLACWHCYEKALDRAEKAEDKILSMELEFVEVSYNQTGKIEILEQQNKEMLSMLEELEWTDEYRGDGTSVRYCPMCGDGYGSHDDDCALCNLLKKVRGD